MSKIRTHLPPSLSLRAPFSASSVLAGTEEEEFSMFRHRKSNTQLMSDKSRCSAKKLQILCNICLKMEQPGLSDGIDVYSENK